MSQLARRMFELVEPIGVIPYSADEPNEAMFALGFTNYWDTYFAGRAAPLGSSVPAEVVHALFYNFAPGEVARHIPKVWSTTTPEAAIAARQQGCVKALRRILGDLVDTPDFARAVELLTKAATSAPLEGRPMYAALRTLPLPEEPVARLFHAASLLREHRGDGHIAALMAEGIGGLEAHVLLALDMGIPAPTFGRIHHLPSAQLTDLIDGMKARGLVEDEATFTPAGRQAKDRVEALTDDLALAPYEVLEPAELDELIAALEPLAQRAHRRSGLGLSPAAGRPDVRLRWRSSPSFRREAALEVGSHGKRVPPASSDLELGARTVNESAWGTHRHESRDPLWLSKFWLSQVLPACCSSSRLASWLWLSSGVCAAVTAPSVIGSAASSKRPNWTALAPRVSGARSRSPRLARPAGGQSRIAATGCGVQSARRSTRSPSHVAPMSR